MCVELSQKRSAIAGLLHDGVHGQAGMPWAGRALLDGVEQVVQLRMAHLGGHVVAAHVVGEGPWAEV